MSRYVITFFERNEKGHRRKRFPEHYYVTYDENGNPSYHHGMMPQTIRDMLVWFDQHPLAQMLRSYKIDWALTSDTSSSIIVNIEADNDDAEEEMLVTLKLFAGRDIRISKPEDLPLRLNRAERKLQRGAWF